MFVSAPCRETVTILEALLFGTDGACIDLGMSSIFWTAMAFIIAVVVLKVLARLLITLIARGIRAGFAHSPFAAPQDTTQDLPDTDALATSGKTPTLVAKPRKIAGPEYDGGPIRSLRPR